MIPIREASYRVEIHKDSMSEYYWFYANPHGNNKMIDVGINVLYGDMLPTKRKVINQWKEFAKINGITKWEVVE